MEIFPLRPACFRALAFLASLWLASVSVAAGDEPDRPPDLPPSPRAKSGESELETPPRLPEFREEEKLNRPAKRAEKIEKEERQIERRIEIRERHPLPPRPSPEFGPGPWRGEGRGWGPEGELDRMREIERGRVRNRDREPAFEREGEGRRPRPAQERRGRQDPRAREQHLREALEHLRLAGFEDIARKVEEAAMDRLRERRERGPGEGTSRDPAVQRQLDELKQAVKELQREMARFQERD